MTVEEVVDDFGAAHATRSCSRPGRWRRRAVPGGATRPTRTATTARDNAFYVAWDAISRDRDTFQRWMQEHVMGTRRLRSARRALRPARLNVITGREMMTVAAARALGERRRLLRRASAAAVGGLQPGAPDARAAHHARLRVGHARDQADRAAALDWRRRAVRDGVDHGVGAGDVPVLAAGWRISVGFLGGAQIDRFGEPEHHGRLGLRRAHGPSARQRRRARESPTRAAQVFIVMRAREARAFVRPARHSSPRSATGGPGVSVGALGIADRRGQRCSSPTSA